MSTAMAWPALPPGPLALVTGARMSRREFLRVWDELPEVKNAELINGVVFMASPVGADHASLDTNVIWWLKSYAHATPGVQAGNNATWMMLDSAPQPDGHLCLAPGLGGSAKRTETFYQGAPELAVEVTETSTSMDFGPKAAVVCAGRSAGVFDLRDSVPPADLAAFWADDGVGMSMAMEAGLSSEEHARFARRLARRSVARGG